MIRLSWPSIVLALNSHLTNAAVPPSMPNHELNLVTERWDWKEASDESKTEWGIVLRRFYMVDTLCFQLQRLLSETLGLNGNSDSGLTGESLKNIEHVLAKAKRNLQKAEEDQSTSD